MDMDEGMGMDMDIDMDVGVDVEEVMHDSRTCSSVCLLDLLVFVVARECGHLPGCLPGKCKSEQ